MILEPFGTLTVFISIAYLNIGKYPERVPNPSKSGAELGMEVSLERKLPAIQ